MNSVEIVKKLCKEKKIAISRLERELGFSNGYIGQLRKGSFPTDRLVLIANYLGVSTDYILTGQKEKPAAPKNDGLNMTAEQQSLIDLVGSGLLSQQDISALLMTAQALAEKGKSADFL